MVVVMVVVKWKIYQELKEDMYVNKTQIKQYSTCLKENRQRNNSGSDFTVRERGNIWMSILAVCPIGEPQAFSRLSMSFFLHLFLLQSACHWRSFGMF